MVTAMSGDNFREDELQLERCQEILQLLVAAGYFRARIKGLSTFDKIVGGFVWCIQVCAFDIEVDLLFNENWNIGKKISLTEKIVRVLKSMKCPHPIEPHQIQGNDYIHIYPVIQWLVKRALETREQTAQYHAAFAKYQLEKGYDITPPKYELPPIGKALRSFRHHAPDSLNREQLIDAVLLEYSQKSRHEEGQNAAILSEMTKVGLADQLPSSSKAQEIVEQRQREIERGIEEWREVQGIDEESEAERISKEIQWKERRLEEMRERLREKKANLDEARDKLATTQGEIEVYKGFDEPEGFAPVRDLLEILEDMKSQESEFKKGCRKELASLKAILEDEKRKSEQDPEVLDEDAVAKEFEEVAQMKRKLGKLNRQVGKFQRTIDQIPTRGELSQFQRRFIELHQQVADVHKETKQYYTMYNTMNDLCVYLEKEIALVNSIQDNFAQALSSSSNREMFFEQVDKSVQGIRQNRVKTERRRHEAKMERDKLHHEYLGLVKQQRSYVKMVGEFRSELRRNQQLMAVKAQHVIVE